MGICRTEERKLERIEKGFFFYIYFGKRNVFIQGILESREVWKEIKEKKGKEL